MKKHYLKLAIRNLEKNKTGSIISVSGLVLALSCAIIIFLFIEQETNYNKYHKNYDNLFLLNGFYPDWNNWTARTNYNLKNEVESSLSGFEGITHYATISAKLTIDNEVKDEYRVLGTDSSYFNLFTVIPISGNLKESVSNPNSIAISLNKAKKLFGSKNALGKNILLNFKDTAILFTVSAVFKDLPNNTDHKPEYIVSISYLKHIYDKIFNDAISLYYTFVLLDKNQESSFSQKLDILNERLNKGYAENGAYRFDIYTYPYSKIYFTKEPDKVGAFEIGNRDLLIAVGCIGLILLVIASINYIGYTTSQIDARSRQSSIQQYVGAQKRQMVWANLTESVLLSLIALPVALIIAEIMIPIINRIYNFKLEINYSENIQFTIGIIAISLLTGLFAGLYQAIILSKIDPIDLLKNSKLKSKSHFRKVIIGLQIFILSGIGLFAYHVYMQYSFAQKFDIGVDKENTMFLRFDVRKYSEIDTHWKTFKEEIKEVPGVKSICFIEDNFPDTGYEEVYEDHKIEPDKKVLIDYMFVEKDFFASMDIKILEGQMPEYFSEDDSILSAVLTARAVEELGITEPIGKIYDFYGEPHKIVAVVNNIYHKGVKHSNPLIFALSSSGQIDIMVKFEPTPTKLALDNVSAIWKSFYPDISMNFESMADNNKKYYQKEKTYQEILFILIGIMLVISISGLYSLSSQLASQRTKEIGIRKVLGGQNNQLKNLLFNEFIPVCIFSNLLSVPLTIFLLNKWLENYAKHITISSFPFIIGLAVTTFIVVASISININKAVNQNPADILRNE